MTLVLPRYINIYRDMKVYREDKTLLILYLVIGNTEILLELGYWSSIDTFNKVKFQHFVLIFYLWQDNINNISCHDIRSYTYVHIVTNFHDIRHKNFYIVAALGDTYQH